MSSRGQALELWGICGIWKFFLVASQLDAWAGFRGSQRDLPGGERGVVSSVPGLVDGALARARPGVLDASLTEKLRQCGVELMWCPWIGGNSFWVRKNPRQSFDACRHESALYRAIRAQKLWVWGRWADNAGYVTHHLRPAITDMKRPCCRQETGANLVPYSRPAGRDKTPRSLCKTERGCWCTRCRQSVPPGSTAVRAYVADLLRRGCHNAGEASTRHCPWSCRGWLR